MWMKIKGKSKWDSRKIEKRRGKLLQIFYPRRKSLLGKIYLIFPADYKQLITWIESRKGKLEKWNFSKMEIESWYCPSLYWKKLIYIDNTLLNFSLNVHLMFTFLLQKMMQKILNRCLKKRQNGPIINYVIIKILLIEILINGLSL